MRAKRIAIASIACVLLATVALADGVSPKVPIKAQAFRLDQVKLLDGPFRHAQELNTQYLRSLDPDRLLHTFRLNAGLPSKAQPLGGWEEPKCELRGHFLGHYLSACALTYAATGDEQLKKNAEYVVGELAKCQEKLGNGYLSAFPESFIDRVEAGKPVWAPWYTLHKIYAGLLDVHLLCGNRQALDVLTKTVDWIESRTNKLSEEQMQKMLGNEHGGVNDALADLYAVTGNEKHLKLSRRFNHRAVLDPLARGEDRLTGLHANTQFPKILGVGRQYELTGEGPGRGISEFFWNVVTKERSYVIGGNSDYEAFSPKEKLSQHIGPNTTETCNTHNMLKITRRIFAWEPKGEYADYYERALYNHILASQHPQTGMVCYYVPLRTGDAKTFSTPNDSFWCCSGTGVESHAKYGDSIYFHDGESLLVNLFIASELSWKERGLKVRQETQYPESDTTRLTFTCDAPAELTVKLRHPAWATRGIEIAVNGQKQTSDSLPGSYAAIRRTWKTGDTIEARMPMSLRAEGFRDNPNKIAFLHGPLVLCAPVEAGTPQPAIVGTPADAVQSLQAVEGKPHAFQTDPRTFRQPGKENVRFTLAPFYQEYQRPYIVYWDALDESQWEKRESEYKAEAQRRQKLDARTVDRVEIGDRDSERVHRYQGERSGEGPFGGRRWRHATDGGFFAYEMKVLPNEPMELLVMYWGSDSGPREFEILVNGQKIASEKLANNRPGQFYDQVYAIPAELTSGKEKVSIRFQALPGKTAGGIFDCRTLKKEE